MAGIPETDNAARTSAVVRPQNVSGEGANQNNVNPNSVVNNEVRQKEQDPELKAELTPLVKPDPPKEPKRKMITYTMPNTMTPAEVADKFHTTWARISELNGGMKDTRIPEHYPLRIEMLTDEQYEKYEAEKSAYETECYRVEGLTKKTEFAQAALEKAKEYGYENEGYSFHIDDETRDIVITLMGEKKMSDVRDDFNIPRGHLANNNNFKEKFGDVKSYDDIKLGTGQKLVVNSYCFKPERPWSVAIKEFFGF